jgi:hypothetical protein
MSKRPSIQWREHLTSPLTWHIVAFSLLLVAVIFLGTRFGLDWAATNDRSSDALQNKLVALKALDLQTGPLRGLDKRVDESRTQMRQFYAKRIPPNYSSIATRIGELAVKAPVRLSRVQYSQGAPGADLTEISMDSSVSGDYGQIMRFVNGLERDPNFFVIRAMNLTGQQGGMVSLRLKVSTWLRPADAAASGLPLTPAEGQLRHESDEAPAATPRKEGF